MQFNRRSGRRPISSTTSVSYIPVKNDASIITNTSADSFLRPKSPRPETYLVAEAKEPSQSTPLKSPPENSPSKSKVYTKDKHLTSKPPIPTSHISIYHRPPTRLSSRNDWESGSTYKETRPASPLTRSSIDTTDVFISRKPLFKFNPLKNTSSSTSSSTSSTPKFKYCGPHQTYPAYEQLLKSHSQGEGPQTIEIPALSDLSLPKSDMESTKPQRSQSPHLISNSLAFHQQLCQAISGFPFNYAQTCHERSHQPKNSLAVPVPCLNNQTKTEPCLFQAFLEQNQNYLLRPTESATNLRRELLSSLPPKLTVPIPQKAPDNNNNHILTSGIDRTETPPWTPSSRNEQEIYEERQILKETVKAMKTMSDQGPFLSTGIPNEIQDDLLRIELLIELRKYKRALSLQLQAHEHTIQMCSSGCAPSPPHLLPHDIGKFPVRQMDPLKIFGEDTSSSSKNSRSKSEEKRETTWEKDLAKHLNSTDFMAAFSNMKPPIVRLSDPGNDGRHAAYTVNPVMIDLQQGNKPQSISLLKEAKAEDFPLSTSVFPSEMMSLLNPSTILSPTPVPHSKSEGGGTSHKENEVITGQSLPGAFQQQYKQFILEKNEYLEKVKKTPPNDYHFSEKSGKNSNVLDSGQMIMLRKPVAISKPRNNSAGYVVSPPNSTSSTPSGEDRPSPFFPGVSGERINMKIRSAEERLQNHSIVSSAQVEELGNLLSQLPVLSRKQKAEEFAFQTLKPPSPVAEADSETSMLPLVSSHGTMTSNVITSGDERPPTNPREVNGVKSGVSQSGDKSQVDTDKMSLHELISLGHKIYGILSQLNTATSKKNLASSSSTGGGHFVTDPNNLVKGQSKSFTNAIDLQSFPNPTFITGPGAVQARSNPKVSVPPKIVQPPPTRWGGRPSVERSIPNLDKVASNRHTHVRSTSSIGSESRPTSNTTRTILNWQAAASRSAAESRSYTVYVPPPAASQSTSTEQARYVRQDTPYPTPRLVDLTASNTTTATQGARSTSKRRNFIRENISKIKSFKKVPPERSRMSQLPPVPRKYDNVSSIVKSASRGRSTSVPTDDYGNVERRRSSSLPPNNQPSNQYRTGAIYTAASRPVSAQSITKSSVVTAQKSKESFRRAPQSTSVPPPPKKKSSGEFKDFKTLLKGRLGIGKTSPNSRSSTKTVESDDKKSIVRKSRSKTRKANKNFSRNIQPVVAASSASSQEIVRVSRTKSKHTSRSSLVRVSSGRNQSGKYNRIGKFNQTAKPNFKQAISKQFPAPQPPQKYEYECEAEEALDPPGEYLTATESEQALIKLMVKQEMDMMVERHVKDALARAKAEKDMDYRFRPADSDHDDSIVNSENLAPAYTPPRFHDESLFSLEKWINPDGPMMGTPYTSDKDTPVTTAEKEKVTNNNRSSAGKGSLKKKTNVNKPQSQTVRFSLPHQNK